LALQSLLGRPKRIHALSRAHEDHMGGIDAEGGEAGRVKLTMLEAFFLDPKEYAARRT